MQHVKTGFSNLRQVRGVRVVPSDRLIGAPWLVNGGHGASIGACGALGAYHWAAALPAALPQPLTPTAPPQLERFVKKRADAERDLAGKVRFQYEDWVAVGADPQARRPNHPLY
eukprot:COSAG01_NODE_2109_length_8408_cov_33.352870_5_plen_114_part_00